MGQKPGTALPYVKFVHHFLKKGSAQVLRSLDFNYYIVCKLPVIIIPEFQKMKL